MRNTRLEMVELFDDRSNFVTHIKSSLVAKYLASKVARVRQRIGERVKSIELLPAPKASDSPTTPATITYGDMMANVGLPAGLHNNFISEGRIFAAQAKIAGFQRPSWADRIHRVSPDVLPNLPSFCS